MIRKYEENSDIELFDLLKSDRETAEKAFAELYARHSPRVYAYCRRFLGDKDDAQDVFQETFIRFYQSADSKRVMTNVPAFILKIARNLCVNNKSRQSSHYSFEEYMAIADNIRPEDNELLGLIKHALELLPDEYREIFIMREYNGLSYNEIAEVTNLSMSLVKVRIHRARQKLREILSPYLADLSKY